MAEICQSILDRITPVVLVGGRSSRFGRDKLIEQVGGLPMVARPIAALRSVFGDRVAIVGACDEQIKLLADAVIEDPYPGLGPVGGICAAIEGARSDVFVCAGDLVSIDGASIRSIVAASIERPDAQAFLARDERTHPTFGLYRKEALVSFQSAITQERLKLGMVIDRALVVDVPVDSFATKNINRPEDL